LQHKPVLLKESIASLNLKAGDVAIDGTLGGGGHSLEILKIIGPEGKLIGLDRDAEAIQRCSEILNSSLAYLHNENYLNIDTVLDSMDIDKVDAILLDIGVSSFQLESPERGFSFMNDAPLDMRMDPSQGKTARDLVNNLSREELESIFHDYGEARWARRFAEAIVVDRRRRTIDTTLDLAGIIEKAMPAGLRFSPGKRPVWMRNHPATRAFQALRIAVNDELSSLQEALPRLWQRIKVDGRLVVISFHSLEDRIVKVQFKAWAATGEGRLVTKKPVTPDEEELRSNNRSRSAKLRAIEKIT